MTIDIRDEAPWQHGAREALLDRVFGPARFEKTSERLREGRLPALALAAVDEDGDLTGTVRLWHVATGDGRPALLLGPLAVAPESRSLGVGGRLMRQALNQAAVAGHGAVVLVGDAPYYARFGFCPSLTIALDLPGPVERHRFLGMELVPGALEGASGCLSAAGPRDPFALAPAGDIADRIARPWPPAR